MPYTIVFRTRNTEDVSAADAKMALEALAIVGALQRRGEEVKSITFRKARSASKCFASWRKRKKSCKPALEPQSC
jgi:hypothetical protein